jgi:hypothetical protein
VNKAQLSEDCHRVIFNVVKQELQDSSVDYTLLTACRHMIRLFCHEEDPSQALVCLKVSLYSTLSVTDIVIVNKTLLLLWVAHIPALISLEGRNYGC